MVLPEYSEARRQPMGLKSRKAAPRATHVQVDPSACASRTPGCDRSIPRTEGQVLGREGAFRGGGLEGSRGALEALRLVLPTPVCWPCPPDPSPALCPHPGPFLTGAPAPLQCTWLHSPNPALLSSPRPPTSSFELSGNLQRPLVVWPPIHGSVPVPGPGPPGLAPAQLSP